MQMQACAQLEQFRTRAEELACRNGLLEARLGSVVEEAARLAETLEATEDSLYAVRSEVCLIFRMASLFAVTC